MTGQQRIALLVSTIRGTLDLCRERLSINDRAGEEEPYMQDCDDARDDLVKLGQTATRSLTALEAVRPFVTQEVEDRKHSGNDEDWADLEAVEKQIIDVLREAGASA